MSAPRYCDGCDARTEQVGVRFTPAELRRVTALADAAGQSVPDFLRRAMEEAARERLAVEAVLTGQSFGVAIPGARERDSQHNGAHDVVLVADIRAVLGNLDGAT